ncbi:MAG: ABC transporter ATP-binding protein/permease [Oscillospiraceae bacterium]|nr:ABC transporter ATP-binding protein/permease [Oscillospiraceae bacterium]
MIKPLTYLRRNGALFAAYALLSLLLVGLSLWIPQFLDAALRRITEGRVENPAALIGSFLLLIAGEGAAAWLVHYLNVYLSNKIAFQAEFDALSHIKRAQYQYTRQHNDAYMAQRINNDSVCLSDFWVEKLPYFASDVLLVMLILPLSFLINPWIGAVMLCGVLLYFAVYLCSRRVYRRRNEAMIESQAQFFAMLSNQIYNLLTIKIHVLYKATDAQFVKTVGDFFLKSVRFLKVDYSIATATALLTRLAYGLGILIIGLGLASGAFAIGNIAVSLLYVQILLKSAQNITQFGKAVQAYQVARDRLRELFAYPLDELGSGLIEQIDAIETQGLGFAFGERMLLEGRNHRFVKGKIYALRGENGSGKSTFVHLLLGIYPPTAGTVRINGADLADLNLDDLRSRLIAYADQVPCLYDGSLYDNLLFGLDEAQRPLREAALAHPLLAFLQHLPQGADTPVAGRKATLSGGERQKISLCRALLKPCQVRIFDEPTNALDPQSIDCLLDQLQRERADYITILISHDARVFAAADEVIDF